MVWFGLNLDPFYFSVWLILDRLCIGFLVFSVFSCAKRAYLIFISMISDFSFYFYDSCILLTGARCDIIIRKCCAQVLQGFSDYLGI